MEGIAGLIGGCDRGLIDRMLRKLYHRGPASSAVYSDDSVMLGARCPRSHNSAPIAMSDGVAAASDSYLFNKEFLRRTIVPMAEPDLSDADLFLRMYKTIGTGMFAYVDGAYSVAIVDRDKAILARDPYGIKPLYLSTGRGPVVFSSEIKSQMLSESRFAPFPPGAYLVSGRRPQRIVTREIPWATGVLPKIPEERLRTFLTSSVSSCTYKTNGANVLLNGGIESGVIAAIAAETVKRVTTTCVGTAESEDMRMALKVADHVGTDHKERIFDKEDVLKILDEVIYISESYDYPLIRACILNLMAVGLLKNKNLVTLSGEGCDEVFAGYEFLRTAMSEAKLRKTRVDLLNNCHWTAFQGVDRITSSASLDCMMPIMSDEIASFGLGLGPKELLGPKRSHTKYVLRKAFENMLPSDVVWRRKKDISDGAGPADIMTVEANKTISDRMFDLRTKLLGGKNIRTKEEMLYYEIFRKQFPNVSALSSVGFTRSYAEPIKRTS